jgi:hypothetical protein
MPEQWRTIELPFETGLEQKTDQFWRDPGTSHVAQNLVKTKSKSLQKRLGLVPLPALGYLPQIGGGLAANPVIGKRMTSIRGNPILIGNDSWTDATFTWSEKVAAWQLTDRIPEVYVAPYEQISSANLGLSYQMDVAIVNGYEVIVFVDPSLDSSSGLGHFFFVVRDAATGALVYGQKEVLTGANSMTDIVKVTAIGTTALVTYSQPTPDNNLFGLIVDCSVSPPAFGASARINTVANDSVNNVSAAFANPYDVCPVIGDASKFGLIYEATRGGTRTIRIVIYTLAGFAVVSDTAIDSNDTQWTTDNGVGATSSQLTALALRVDSGNSEAAYAYGWRTLAGATRVSTGIRNYTAMTNKATPVNLMSTVVGSMSAANDNPPAIVTIERVGGSTNPANYSVRMSPGSGVFDQGAAQLPYIASWQAANAAGTMTVQANQPRLTVGISLWSRDVLQNGIAYCMGHVPSTTQGSFFLLADDAWNDTNSPNFPAISSFPLRLVGNIAPRLAGPLTPTVAAPKQSRVATHIPAAPQLGAGYFVTLVAVATAVQLATIARVPLDFGSALLHQGAELGPNLLVSNGSPSAFDGQYALEIAFPVYPVITSVTFGAGGALSAGVYNWIAIYEWQDARGQKHRSGRSVPFTATATANQQATVSIAMMGYSAKAKAFVNVGLNGPQGIVGGNFQRTLQIIKLYRTQVNGTIYNNATGAIAGSDAASTITVDLIHTTNAVVDGNADATILSHALLYGDGSDGTSPGNILDNLCPPASQAMVVHQNRALFVDGPRIWPTKVFTAGEGAGVNEATAFSVDDGPGNVLGLASMDDKLILFKSDRLLYMTGLGPSDNGTGNDWSPPQRIASDCGLVDWRSIVSTPQGIYFMSPVGRRLLTRDLQVVPVSIVEDLDTTYPVVTSAVIHPALGRVLWTQCTDNTTTPRVGAMVIHDYVTDSWTSATYSDNSGNHNTVGMVSAAIASIQTSAGPPATIKQGYHILRADGTVLREDITTGHSFDGNVAGSGVYFVFGTWTSPWLKGDGFQGWMAWRLLRVSLQVLDPAGVTISIAYNYNPGAIDTRSFTASQISVMTQQGVALFEIRPSQPRAASMQVTIVDSLDGSSVTGAGFRFEHVRVDYDVEIGGYRAPSGQRG